MKLILISLCYLLLVTACSSTISAKQAPVFDARLMEECPELLAPPITSFSDVLDAKALDTKAYIKCKNTHKGLINSVQEYQKEFNK